MRESATASHIRLHAAECNVDLWRNNVGALKDDHGRLIRYGLCNDSPILAKRIKSSDFIGVTPTVITQDMVGQTIGVFTAVETKATGWKLLPSDKRGIAQKAFIDIVLKNGGFAGFAQSIQEFRKIIRR